VKMTTAKWTLIQERSRIYAILLDDLRYTPGGFNEKECLQACGGDALIWHNVMVPIRTL